MRFNLALTSALFFASAVLADRLPQPNVVEKRTNTTSDAGDVVYSNWAGATWIQSVPSFHNISGTFEVPQVSGPTDSAVGIWVGIDGNLGTQCGAFFQAGVGCIITSDGPVYRAVAEWSTQAGNEFTDIDVSPGDVIEVTVSVASDQTTGYATLANFGHGMNQTKSQTLKFSDDDRPALCQLSAEWIISRVGDRDLANFGVVSFTKPLALGRNDQKFTPAGSVISDIPMNGTPVTSVYADENVVTITYV